MSSPEIFSSEPSVKIDSKERLRAELGIMSPLDIPEISQTFEVTKKDLEDFKKTLESVPSAEQIEKIKTFITEKSEVVNNTKDRADAFKKSLAVGWAGVVVTDMGKVFRENISDLQNSEGVDIFDKGMTFFDKMENMWDKLILSFASTKFGKILLDFFGFETPRTESVMENDGNVETEKEKEENVAQKSDSLEAKEIKNTSDARFLLSTKAFSRFYIKYSTDQSSFDKREKRERVQAIYSYSQFNTLKLSQATDLHTRYVGNSEGVIKELKLENTWIKWEDVFSAIESIVQWSGKQFISQVFKWKDISDMTLKEIFEWMSSELWPLGKFSELEFSSAQDLVGALPKLSSSMNFDILNWGEVSGVLQEKYESLGLSKSIGTFALVSDIKLSHLESSQGISSMDISSEDREVLHGKIIPFWNSFKEVIIEKFSFWQKDVYREFLNKNVISLKEIMYFYIIAGGDSKYENLNDAEQAMIFIRLHDFLWRDPAFRWEFFNKKLLEELDLDTINNIPPGVKNMFSSLFGKAVDTLMEWAENRTIEIWNSLTTEAQATLAIVIPLSFIAAWRTRWALIVANTALIASVLVTWLVQYRTNKWEYKIGSHIYKDENELATTFLEWIKKDN